MFGLVCSFCFLPAFHYKTKPSSYYFFLFLTSPERTTGDWNFTNISVPPAPSSVQRFSLMLSHQQVVGQEAKDTEVRRHTVTSLSGLAEQNLQNGHNKSDRSHFFLHQLSGSLCLLTYTPCFCFITLQRLFPHSFPVHLFFFFPPRKN